MPTQWTPGYKSKYPESHILRDVYERQAEAKKEAVSESWNPLEDVTPIGGFRKLGGLALGSLAFPDLLSRFMWQATKRRVPQEFQRIIRAIEADPRQLAIRALARPDPKVLDMGSSLGKYFWPAERVRQTYPFASPEQIQAILQSVRVRPQAVVDLPGILRAKQNPFSVLAHEVVGHGGQEVAGKFDVAFPGLAALDPRSMEAFYPTRLKRARELLPLHIEQRMDPLRLPPAYHVGREDPGAFTRALTEWWPE